MFQPERDLGEFRSAAACHTFHNCCVFRGIRRVGAKRREQDSSICAVPADAEGTSGHLHLTQSKNPNASSSERSLAVCSAPKLLLGNRAGPTSTPSIFIVALAAPM